MDMPKTKPDYIAEITVTHGTKSWSRFLGLYVSPKTVAAAYKKAAGICEEHNRTNTNGTRWEITSIYTFCDISDHQREVKA